MTGSGHTGPDPTDADPVGTAAEEAVKLLRALASGAREEAHAGAPEQARHPDATDHTCPNGWCPVCRVADWVRDNPEVVENLTDAAMGLARSVRDALDTVVASRDRERGASPDDIVDH